MSKVKIVQNGVMFEISDDLRLVRVNKTTTDHVKMSPRAGHNPSEWFFLLTSFGTLINLLKKTNHKLTTNNQTFHFGLQMGRPWCWVGILNLLSSISTICMK